MLLKEAEDNSLFYATPPGAATQAPLDGVRVLSAQHPLQTCGTCATHSGPLADGTEPGIKEWPLGGSSVARVLEKVTPSLEERAPGRELPARVGSAPAGTSEEVCSVFQNVSQTVPSAWDKN